MLQLQCVYSMLRVSNFNAQTKQTVLRRERKSVISGDTVPEIVTPGELSNSVDKPIWTLITSAATFEFVLNQKTLKVAGEELWKALDGYSSC